MIDLSTRDARLALVRKYAAKYSLDPALVAAICEHESQWNPWAMRYEPMFYSRYIAPMLTTGKVKSMTEGAARATSYGLMQVMGQVAREYGFTGQYLTELCDPDVGVDYGCRKLEHCLEVTTDLRVALLAYNGGGNQQYPDMVLPLMAKYRD